MGDILVVIGILVLSIGYYYVKGKVAAMSDTQDSSTTSADSDDPFAPFDDAPFDDAPFDTPQQETPYFTYESDNYAAAAAQPARQSAAKKGVAKSKKAPHVETAREMVVEDEGCAFDLRQAVIAQTILHNKYIDEKF